ncbi:MAG: hypothetical protein HYS14_07715 [Candidatus Rokubacteria bacterium]|nr:hypothetical protein [Candidatus Rokubacteria bacterium]MBI3455965.1 hypothetical protein [Candidatus Rokubacteria bacterium]
MTRLDAGARWLRCDLHVHTPFDPEKRFGENVRHAIDAFRKEKPQRLAEIAMRFVEACRKAVAGEGMDLVAVTDHNSIEGYRYLRPQFDVIAQQAKDQGLPMPVILPGVEFTVGGERPLHILVIFAAATSPDEIEGAIRHVFGTRHPFHPKTGTPESSGQGVDDFLKRFYDWCRPTSGERRLSFVVLPAHADGDRGVDQETRAGAGPVVAPGIWDEMKGHLREWVITRVDWHGFQTLRPYPGLPRGFQDLLARWMAARQGLDWEALGERDRRRFRERERWPLIEASDPHVYEEIGAHFTWLKMEVPDVEGIRLALLDPESRLRRMAEGRPAQDHPRFRHISIRRTDFFEAIEVPINPSLNTLIGGRGAGKSTLIECLRYALDRARAEDFEEDEREVRESVQRLLSRKKERDYGESSGVLLPGHEIAIELELAGRLYRVVRSERGHEIIPDPDDAGAAPTPLDVRALIAPRILSQRQIARIAKDPAAQRRELDAMAGAEFSRSFDGRHRTLLERLELLQASRRGLKDRAATLPARQTELQKMKDQIAFLERGGNKEILERFRALQAEQRWLDGTFEALESTAGRLENEAAEVEQAAERLGPAPEGPTKSWTESISERVSRKLGEVRTELESLAAGLRAFREETEGERVLQWAPGFEAAQRAYLGLQQEMREKGVEFRQHERLLQQRALIEREVSVLSGLQSQIERTESDIHEVRSELVRLREERLLKRRMLAETFEREDADVRLEIIPFEDRRDLASHRDEWFGGAGLQERDWEILTSFIFSGPSPDAVPVHLADLVRAVRRDIEETRARGKPLETSESSVAAVLGEAAKRLTRNFFNALQRGDRIQLDAMERFLPEDWVIARVRDAYGEFRPIEQGSVGLRSTAVLSLLLAAGEQPLVIDQPEDDLDNQYVYSVVVDLLRKRKFSRQIIIATHNANIPVNGDAELIVALEVENRLGRVRVMGSIDKLEVKEVVSEIMEGSPEAFRLRLARYGY